MLFTIINPSLSLLMKHLVGLNIFISETIFMAITIIVIYINIIGLERKQYSLFGSSPSHVK